VGVERLAAAIEAQRPSLALWIPVLYGLGIAVYFALPAEPQGWMLAALGGVAMVLAGTALRAGPLGRALLLALLLPALGFGAAALRTRSVAAPVLGHEQTVNVEGRIIALDRSASDRPRVLLDRVVLHGVEPGETPARVRVSLDPETPAEVLQPGVRLLAWARLSPPAAPAEPGGFDFRRIAWFEQIGAVGYALAPAVEAAAPDRSDWRQLAFRARMAASAHIRAQIPGQDGAFASAILTGDRSGMDRSVDDALRASNLYHIVSISGLHMALLTAAVFALVRYGLALVPWLALHWPLKKIAACAALAAGAVYLVISGAEVPAQRSYVMTAAVLVAVLLDRPALTMRSVALAGLVVLVLAPESLTQAGFQMSFAASVALIAVYDGLRTRPWWQLTQASPRWRFAKPVLGIAMTSLVAGVATAPFSAFHFNQLAQYGLLANLLAVPAMGVVVMPAAVMAVIAWPFGLDWLPFQVVGLGMGYIIAVGEWIAGLGGAVVGVPAAPPAVLWLLVAGGLLLVLWSGRGRWAGLAPMVLALLVWASAERPEILIAENGRLFGILTPEGRALSSGRGNGFVALSWLRNDGDGADQPAAAARADMARGRGRAEIEVPGLGAFRYLGSRAADARTRDACRDAGILLAPRWREQPEGGCLFIGAERLRRDGALAIRLDGPGMAVAGARAVNRNRPWTADPRAPAAADGAAPLVAEAALNPRHPAGAQGLPNFIED
jgi:competence protein ComEC